MKWLATEMESRDQRWWPIGWESCVIQKIQKWHCPTSTRTLSGWRLTLRVKWPSSRTWRRLCAGARNESLVSDGISVSAIYIVLLFKIHRIACSQIVCSLSRILSSALQYARQAESRVSGAHSRQKYLCSFHVCVSRYFLCYHWDYVWFTNSPFIFDEKFHWDIEKHAHYVCTNFSFLPMGTRKYMNGLE